MAQPVLDVLFQLWQPAHFWMLPYHSSKQGKAGPGPGVGPGAEPGAGAGAEAGIGGEMRVGRKVI